MGNMTNVLVVEDERLASEALCSYVNSAPDRYTLVMSIRNADDAELVCLKKHIDLIIMDICTFASNGIEVAEAIKRKFPNIKVIIVTSTVDTRFLSRARETKMDSFWHKEASLEAFVDVMDRTMAGESVYIDEMPNVMIGCCPSHEFRKRQLETVYWMLKLGKISLVARQMNISEDGVKKHIKDMKSMTGIEDTGKLLRTIEGAKLVMADYY